MTDLTLAALSIARRTAALAFFAGNRIEDVSIHHLPTNISKAAHSLAGFLNSTFEPHHIAFMALESPLVGCSERATALHAIAVDTIREAGIPMVEVPTHELLSSYGVPALRRREQLRLSAQSIWPSLNNPGATHTAQDAAVLGLHVQVERFFTLCEAVR
jgi:hypothetical protein